MKTPYIFDIAAVPHAGTITKAIFVLILAVGCLVAPTFIPAVYRDKQRQTAFQSLAQFELLDVLNPGLFHQFPRATDTFPSEEAALYALSAAQSLGKITEVFKKTEYLKKHIQNELSELNEESSIDHIYNLLKIADLLTPPTATTAEEGAIEKDPMQIASLAGSLFSNVTGGFRMSIATRRPSIDATFYALEVLNMVKQEIPEGVMQFITQYVLEQQDAQFGGFRQMEDSEMTLSSTFNGFKILLRLNQSDPRISFAMTSAARFVMACQVGDGGFHETPVFPTARAFTTPSTSAVTAKGLYVLATMMKRENEEISASVFSNALNYLAATFSCHDGVVTFPTSKITSLEGSYYASLLLTVQDIPNGYIHCASQIIRTVGILLLVVAATVWYKPQMNQDLYKKGMMRATKVMLFVGLPVAVLTFYPPMALPAYLALMGLLTSRFYHIISSRDVDGSILSVATVSSFAYLGLIMGLQLGSPIVLSQPSIYLILVAWASTCALAVAYGTGYFIGKKPATFYVDVAVISWMINLAGTGLLLFSRDVQFVYRLLLQRGQREVFLIGAPVLSLILMELESTLGFVLYAGPATGGKLQIKKLLSFFKSK